MREQKASQMGPPNLQATEQHFQSFLVKTHEVHHHEVYSEEMKLFPVQMSPILKYVIVVLNLIKLFLVT